VLTAFADSATLFRKTSCAVSFVHGLLDYNGRYGISELCDICPLSQLDLCRSAHRVPTAAQIRDLARALPEADGLMVNQITTRAAVVAGLPSEEPRYYLQHALNFQVHDATRPTTGAVTDGRISDGEATAGVVGEPAVSCRSCSRLRTTRPARPARWRYQAPHIATGQRDLYEHGYRWSGIAPRAPAVIANHDHERRYVRRYRSDRVRPASAGLDVLRRSSWSSRSPNRRNRCPTVDA
jgi:hypothetical protein